MNKNTELEHLQKELSDIKGQINDIHGKRLEFMRSYNEKLSKAKAEGNLVKVKELWDSLVKFDTLANSKINKLRSKSFVLNNKTRKTRSVPHATRSYSSSNNIRVSGVTRSKSSANVNTQPDDSYDLEKLTAVNDWKYKKTLKAAKDEVNVFFMDLKNADRLWRNKKIDKVFENETDVRKEQNFVVNHTESGTKQNSDESFWETLKKNEERWNSEQIYKRVQEDEQERIRYDKSHGTSIAELDNKLAELELSEMNVNREIRDKNKSVRVDTYTNNFSGYSGYGQHINPYVASRNNDKENVNKPHEEYYSGGGGIYDSSAVANTTAEPKEYHDPAIGGVSVSGNIYGGVGFTGVHIKDNIDKLLEELNDTHVGELDDKKMYTNDGFTPRRANENESDFTDVDIDDEEFERTFKEEFSELDNETGVNDESMQANEQLNSVSLNKCDVEKIDDAGLNDAIYEIDKESDYSDIGFDEKRVNFVLSCEGEGKKSVKDTSVGLQRLSECLNKCSELGMKPDVVNGICNNICNDLKQSKIKCEIDGKGNYVVQGRSGIFLGIGGNLNKIRDIVGTYTDKVYELIKGFVEKAKSNKWHQSMNKAQERSYQQNRCEVKVREENIKSL